MFGEREREREYADSVFRWEKWDDFQTNADVCMRVSN